MEPIRGAMMKKKRRSKNFTFRFKGQKYRVRKSGVYLILIVVALIVCAFQIPGMPPPSSTSPYFSIRVFLVSPTILIGGR